MSALGVWLIRALAAGGVTAVVAIVGYELFEQEVDALLSEDFVHGLCDLPTHARAPIDRLLREGYRQGDSAAVVTARVRALLLAPRPARAVLAA